jgi:hypothetical protein
MCDGRAEVKNKQSDVVRWALLDAIKWQKSFLDSYAGVSNSDEVRSKATARIAAFEALLDRKYGGVPPDPMEGAKNVDIRDI